MMERNCRKKMKEERRNRKEKRMKSEEKIGKTKQQEEDESRERKEIWKGKPEIFKKMANFMDFVTRAFVTFTRVSLSFNALYLKNCVPSKITTKF